MVSTNPSEKCESQLIILFHIISNLFKNKIHVPKHQPETLVDVGTFLQGLSTGSSALLPLRARQIHQIQLGKDVLRLVLFVLLVHLNGKNGMRPRAHLGCGKSINGTKLGLGFPHVSPPLVAATAVKNHQYSEEKNGKNRSASRSGARWLNSSRSSSPLDSWCRCASAAPTFQHRWPRSPASP